MNRRDAVKLAAGAVAVTFTASDHWRGAGGAAAQTPPADAFKLPPLGYAYEALEPHIDTQTMRIHHGTHHAAYVKNLNGFVEKHPPLASAPMEQTLGSIAQLPAAIQDGVRNNMGGHWNQPFSGR